MRIWVALGEATRCIERVAALMVELIVAAVVIAGAVFVGHELREWREWYWALPPTFEVAPSAPAATEP